MADDEKTPWERLDKTTARLKVPGGWVLRSVAWYTDSVSLHHVFVADPEHEWKLEGGQ